MSKVAYKKWCKEQDKKFLSTCELCGHCMEWLSQDDVGFNDFPHCAIGDKYEAHQYVSGYTNECPYFMES